MAQPWRAGDVTMVATQISNNNSSMRLNNAKNIRSSGRTLKQQPIINSPPELEVISIVLHIKSNFLNP